MSNHSREPEMTTPRLLQHMYIRNSRRAWRLVGVIGMARISSILYPLPSVQQELNVSNYYSIDDDSPAVFTTTTTQRR